MSASAKSSITISPLFIILSGMLTREKAVVIGLYCVDGQARVFLLPEFSSPPSHLGQDYEQNGFGEKRSVFDISVHICEHTRCRVCMRASMCSLFIVVEGRGLNGEGSLVYGKYFSLDMGGSF